MSGRIRTVKPEWLEDELLASQQDHVRLLSIALILLSDDHGRGRAAPAAVASLTWMFDPSPETLTKAEGGLSRLAEIGFIRLYTVENQHYFEVRNWAKHQKVQHAGAPRVPPPSAIRETLRNPPEDLAPDQGSRIEDQGSRIKDLETPARERLTNGKAKKASGRTRCPPSTDPKAPPFLELWKIPAFESEQGANVQDFLDHHSSKGSTMVDWSAAWRTWDRNGAKFGRREGPARLESETDTGPRVLPPPPADIVPPPAGMFDRFVDWGELPKPPKKDPGES